ncbi:MAG TPA: hypothetical protein DCG19_04215 [Cryomorphaceae bacterium]|nr:hypothetical protein [Owenweeksia sp.]MBF99605.1 hypothetical protein [Owenweeksia sp.]HAD96586.1 hypothetical protein [Cryomorphaceae bacterium]HBF21684.1 hypothetical protein [Cryomorphaceae bacterium]HCQ15782.1 hypothetical protein [Cryomorphaceae bacterium]|tara:strand:- start:446 stop:1897 length:1452 start_codon:yes stop_codon:yes gene_type:complete
MEEIFKPRFYKPSLNLIESLNQSKVGVLPSEGSQIKPAAIEINLSPKGYAIDFDPSAFEINFGGFDLGKFPADVPVLIDNTPYELTSLFITNRSTRIKKNFLSRSISGFVTSLQSPGFNKSLSCFYRMVIPLQKKMSFLSCIEDVTVSTDITGKSRNALCVRFNDETIVCIVLEYNDATYLVIDAEQPISFDPFSDYAFSIINSLGYVTGHLAGTHGYFFSYRNFDMAVPDFLYYHSIRPEIISLYEPLCTMPRDYLHNMPEQPDYYESEVILSPLSLDQLSRLSQALYDSVELTSVIHLILESSAASLIFRPGGYAIALETLANILKPPQKQKLNPLSPSNWKHLRKTIIEVLESLPNKSDVVEDRGLIERRINDLNKPTNHARLKAAFENLNIELTNAEVSILNARNDLLHGRIPDITNQKKSRSLERMNGDMFYSALRLYDMLNMLILKSVGYNSYILNHVKLEEENCQMTFEEEPYRKI